MAFFHQKIFHKTNILCSKSYMYICVYVYNYKLYVIRSIKRNFSVKTSYHIYIYNLILV